MSLDITIHTENSFRSPTELIEDGNVQLAQAFIALLLTPGIPLFPDLGSELDLGRRNTSTFQAHFNGIVSSISNQMRDEYSLSGITVTQFSTQGNSITVRVLFEKLDGTTSNVEISI